MATNRVLQSTTADDTAQGGGHAFGTAPVFLASVSTILGAILFLRFGYAVGNTGLIGTVMILLVGHLVTIPTALAIAEISTNRRVEGGGEYFIISRSFGTSIGGAIGLSLYVSRAVSVAFYMIAFAEAFRPLEPAFNALLPFDFDPRMISLPATLVLGFLIVSRGAAIGVRALWGVAAILGLSLVMFFLGSPVDGHTVQTLRPLDRIPNADPFILVFAIVFPAFTGMAAGVGLSGDLANPRKSIPLGVIGATIFGLVIYLLVTFKLASSAPPEVLAGDPLVMSKIALWGPIIPIGLAAATLSSAIGSIIVAPRILQALGADRIFPTPKANTAMAAGVGDTNEPRAATIVTVGIALVTVLVGNVDSVARLITMFFMVTYGALCLISALEHFAARPSYRPTFRSKWYLSLLGAVMSLILMFQIQPFYAVMALAMMVGLYYAIRLGRGSDDIAALFQGAMTQATRYSQVKLQASNTLRRAQEWRPSVIMVNGRTFSRSAPIQMLSWLCQRYGFGTYIHFIRGNLTAETFRESRKLRRQLVEITQARRSAIYVDAIISPSIRSALAQALQLPGVTGMDNNSILLECRADDDPEVLREVEEGCRLAAATRMNSLVLRHGEHFFGSRTNLHIWLTWHDYDNANLITMLAYILLGHRDWQNAEVRIFAAVPQAEASERRGQLNDMIDSGRLPISRKNLRIIPTDEAVDFDELVATRSAHADLVIFGFTKERLKERGVELFMRHQSLHDVLFVSAEQQVLIE